MYYIKQIEDAFIKYEVKFDDNELRTIKYKIIYNCGEVKHFSYEDSRCRHNPMSWHIKNFSQDFVRVQEYNDFYSSPEDIYRYSYDLYEDTPLSKLVDRLRNGDTSVIGLLESRQEIEHEFSPTDNLRVKEEELRTKISEVLTVNTTDINTWELEKLKKQLDEFQINHKLNENRESESSYYQQVLDLITMEEVCRIDNENIEKANSLLMEAEKLIGGVKPFFENSKKEQIAPTGYQKVISKIFN